MTFITWWGAGLSTLLAMVKIWEIWRARFQIDISGDFTSSPEIGNKIFIRNISSSPAILSYWQVLYVSGTWPFQKYAEIASPESEISDIRFEPHSSETLRFSEETHFSSSPEFLKGRKIYVRLYFAGKGRFMKKVYG